MNFTATITVPALPDNDVWFLNSAAWQNYWQNISLDAELDEIDNEVYVYSNYDTAIPEPIVWIEGDQYFLVSKAQFDSLKAQVAALDASYRQLRLELQTAGILKNAQ